MGGEGSRVGGGAVSLPEGDGSGKRAREIADGVDRFRLGDDVERILTSEEGTWGSITSGSRDWTEGGLGSQNGVSREFEFATSMCSFQVALSMGVALQGTGWSAKIYAGSSEVETN
jgi:hypothetical protein